MKNYAIFNPKIKFKDDRVWITVKTEYGNEEFIIPQTYIEIFEDGSGELTIPLDHIDIVGFMPA